MQFTDPKSDANESLKVVNRRDALKTIGAVSTGLTGAGAISGTASARVAGPPNGDGSFPITYTKESEDEFEQFYTNANESRNGVFRKVTQITEHEPQHGAGSDVSTQIDVSNVAESVYTDDTVEEWDLDNPACFQHDQNEIEITHPEYAEDAVRFEFEKDTDHISGFVPPSNEIDEDTADVATAVVGAGFTALQELGGKAGKAFTLVGAVSSASDLAASLYEWFDDQDGSSYNWNWQKPDAAPDGFPEGGWAPGRACTTSTMRFEVEHDYQKDVTPEFTVRDTTLGSAHGRTHELDWTVG